MHEKNGAISNHTPGPQDRIKQAGVTQEYFVFPETAKQADSIDTDTLKQAADLVKNAFKPSK